MIMVLMLTMRLMEMKCRQTCVSKGTQESVQDSTLDDDDGDTDETTETMLTMQVKCGRVEILERKREKRKNVVYYTLHFQIVFCFQSLHTFIH